MVPVDTFTFPLEIHFLPDIERSAVDIVGKLKIDWVANQRLVNEKLVLILQLLNHS
jgi:hypothetical protein